MTETKWLTVAETSLLCSQMGLERTPKTIRGWARNEHVNAQKKSTSNGEMWILDKASLETKIKTEIEYRDQMKANQTSADPSEPVQTRAHTSEPVRTRSDPSGSEQKNTYGEFGQNAGFHGGSYRDEPRPNPSERGRIQELESQNQSLQIDVAWRQKMLEKITAENEKGQESLHAQARYIGHLESDLLRLGGKPNEKFLSAPTPKADQQSDVEPEPFVEPEIMQSQRPHPDQQTFYSGHSG